MKYTLPLPPSINRKFISRTYVVSSEYRKYKSDVQLLLSSESPTEAPIYICANFFFKDKRRDIDSGLKVLLDAMQGYVFKNDSQVSLLLLSKRVDKNNPRVEVEMMEIIDEDVKYSMVIT